jgi:predicted transposase/invertase (TIGR01784 family)
MNERYINPFTDFGFKKLFGSEPNKDLLLDFLNELIKEHGHIRDLTYLNSEQLGLSQYERRAVFDLYCESDTGEKFIVEMQKAEQKYFKDRSVFYSTFPIRDQAQRGNWNFKLNAVYTVGILNFVFDEDKHCPDYFHHHVQLMETKRKKVFYDKLTYIYLEMPKFTKTEEQLDTHFDKWLYVLKNLSKLDNRPKRIEDRIFKRLFEAAEISQFDPSERAAYEESIKVYRDMVNVMDTQLEKGLEKGREEGREKGREEGREEERKFQEKLRQEELIKIAKLAKSEGIPVSLISKMTGFSKEEIENL